MCPTKSAMKKPANLDFDPRVLGNGQHTHAKGKAKFEGAFKHPGNKGMPSSTGAKKIIGRGK